MHRQRWMPSPPRGRFGPNELQMQKKQANGQSQLQLMDRQRWMPPPLRGRFGLNASQRQKKQANGQSQLQLMDRQRWMPPPPRGRLWMNGPLRRPMRVGQQMQLKWSQHWRPEQMKCLMLGKELKVQEHTHSTDNGLQSRTGCFERTLRKTYIQPTFHPLVGLAMRWTSQRPCSHSSVHTLVHMPVAPLRAFQPMAAAHSARPTHISLARKRRQ